MTIEQEKTAIALDLAALNEKLQEVKNVETNKELAEKVADMILINLRFLDLLTPETAEIAAKRLNDEVDKMRKKMP